MMHPKATAVVLQRSNKTSNGALPQAAFSKDALTNLFYGWVRLNYALAVGVVVVHYDIIGFSKVRAGPDYAYFMAVIKRPMPNSD